MSETALKATFVLLIATLSVALIVIIAVGTVYLVYSMVTGMMDEIQERGERDET